MRCATRTIGTGMLVGWLLAVGAEAGSVGAPGLDASQDTRLVLRGDKKAALSGISVVREPRKPRKPKCKKKKHRLAVSAACLPLPTPPTGDPLPPIDVGPDDPPRDETPGDVVPTPEPPGIENPGDGPIDTEPPFSGGDEIPGDFTPPPPGTSSTPPVPEPGAFAVFATGLALVGAALRRRG